jgi:hypothetical protein
MAEKPQSIKIDKDTFFQLSNGRLNFDHSFETGGEEQCCGIGAYWLDY